MFFSETVRAFFRRRGEPWQALPFNGFTFVGDTTVDLDGDIFTGDIDGHLAPLPEGLHAWQQRVFEGYLEFRERQSEGSSLVDASSWVEGPSPCEHKVCPIADEELAAWDAFLADIKSKPKVNRNQGASAI